MSDYWKSQPRKFCDMCKCWFADNKSSIEFHEKGKNHQENVKKRINQIQKKGLKDFKAKKKLDNQMDKMEKAALAAFKKDVEKNPELAEQYKLEAAKQQDAEPKEIPPLYYEPVKRKANTQSQGSKKQRLKSQKVWYEAKSDEGDTYFWNSVTSESRWETPKEGYISLKAQNATTTAAETSTSQTIANSEGVEISRTFGPQEKSNPYGQWVSVDEEEKVSEPVDWQLPTKSSEVVEVTIPLHKDTFKIKEKTVGQRMEEFSSGESTFKKRKNFGNRNVRQRGTDD